MATAKSTFVALLLQTTEVEELPDEIVPGCMVRRATQAEAVHFEALLIGFAGPFGEVMPVYERTDERGQECQFHVTPLPAEEWRYHVLADDRPTEAGKSEVHENVQLAANLAGNAY